MVGGRTTRSQTSKATRGTKKPAEDSIKAVPAKAKKVAAKAKAAPKKQKESTVASTPPSNISVTIEACKQ